MKKTVSKKLAISSLTIAQLTTPQLKEVACAGPYNPNDSILTIEDSCQGACFAGGQNNVRG